MKKLVVLGAGESGKGTAILAQKQGFDVFVSDAGSIAPKTKSLLTTFVMPTKKWSKTKTMLLVLSER